jgi:hypothetical protein
MHKILYVITNHGNHPMKYINHIYNGSSMIFSSMFFKVVHLLSK